ncbi:MAG: helix-turn-helix transcriptional regulator [Rhodanobacteraceae bacterium]
MNYFDETRWVAIKEIVIDFGIGRQTLWRWRESNDFPPERKGVRPVQYWSAAVVDWLIRHRKFRILRHLGFRPPWARTPNDVPFSGTLQD